MFLPIVTSLSTTTTIRNPVQACEPRPRGRSNGVSPCRARRTSTEPFCVCENNPRILLNFFFLWKLLMLQYFHIFEFSSSSCLFGFGRFRCALVFLILILCVWLRENVCMCPYVCCGGRAMWRRCACDTDIERCECANDHAWVRHRQMSIRCVYMRERSSSLLVCVCVCVRERERGASVTQQPSLSIRPSLARSHATHSSTRTFWHPHPALPTSRPAQSLREYPV